MWIVTKIPTTTKHFTYNSFSGIWNDCSGATGSNPTRAKAV